MQVESLELLICRLDGGKNSPLLNIRKRCPYSLLSNCKIRELWCDSILRVKLVVLVDVGLLGQRSDHMLSCASALEDSYRYIDLVFIAVGLRCI